MTNADASLQRRLCGEMLFVLQLFLTSRPE